MSPEEVTARGEDTAMTRDGLVLHTDAEVKQHLLLSEGLENRDQLLSVSVRHQEHGALL